ncbi:hypothetical protein BMF94_5050 [Rhodotorula taiwanensis]|uniref:F-box domain-containing protein n=1 Tax=Rhodotorula taiwanensis TaxID=741276 RepID=A0A2S5B549_9BASI|nr:hypothetical protein BMF94_5050 [Rhodotorula taiwanensis]
MPELETPAKAIEAPNDGSLASPRVTILSLPDELISEIFRQVHAMYMHKKRNMPPTSYLCINKRLTTLAQPIWLSVLCAPQDKTNAERFFLGLLCAHERLYFVRELEWTVSAGEAAYRKSLLGQLRNLDTLRLRQLDPQGLNVDWQLYAFVNRLTAVKSLILLAPNCRMSGWDRALARPKHLDFHVTDLLPGLFQQGYPSVCVHVDKDLSVPWLLLRPLQKLEIVFGATLTGVPHKFLNGLLVKKSSIDRCKKLARLCLTFCRPTDVLETWQSLRPFALDGALTLLELQLPLDFDLDALQLGIATLRHLTLSTERGRAAPLCIRGLVVGCLRLSRLTLIGFDWYEDATPDVPGSLPEEPSDYADCPNLHLCLCMLQDETDLLELRIRSSDEPDLTEYRWYRSDSDDQFSVAAFS